MRSYAGPVVLLLLGVAMFVGALLLDRGGEQSRDAALLVGTAALYLVVPAALLWAVAVLYVRSRTKRDSSGTR